jgi:hypothetical protein
MQACPDGGYCFLAWYQALEYKSGLADGLARLHALSVRFEKGETTGEIVHQMWQCFRPHPEQLAAAKKEGFDEACAAIKAMGEEP